MNDISSRVDRIKAKLNEDPCRILEHFNIEYKNRGTYLQAVSPCHPGADNSGGLTLWTEGYIGSWKCYTKLCNEDFGSDSIGLVAAILACRKGKTLYFSEVLDYCERNIGIATECEFESDLSRLCKTLKRDKVNNTVIGNKRLVNELDIPSKYFLSRGYSKDTLFKFSIGDCTNPQKPMYNRAVCPIFDEEGESLIGCAGRTIVNKDYLQKWKYSFGFKSGSNLYGLWLAKKRILETSRIILVEGMMDVAKLHEMGYYNTCGLYGVNLTNNQLDILNRLGVMRVDFLLDGDEAGEVAGKRNLEKCKDYFNVKVHKLPNGKDPDELSKVELECLFKK